MSSCPSCGEENPERARFCLNCGNPLAAEPAAHEVRKTVTILFADVVSSTSRAEQADPESTRRLLARYFVEMRAVIERHGGTVEKFIGDAVMAVFGIPVLHEDDALRAARAALDITAAIGRLNEELVGPRWPSLTLRIGINTGEVVAGDSSSAQTLVTGDPVNVAARLEQAAGPGEIVMGATTHRLVRHAVEAEPMPPLELRGKASPVSAYRLLHLVEPDVQHRHETPLVGRQRELGLLRDAYQRAQDEEACYLFTLLGTAGVGKSRLIHEFVSTVRAGATILRARCLPYGEGITFWPVVELVQAAAGIASSDPTPTARDKLAALVSEAPDAEEIVERIVATVGLSEAVIPTEESFWAVRKLLETMAAKQPLVAVIDDLQWAEPTMLDLVDHVTDWSREAPILLVAVARPELLETRPLWGGGKRNATTIELQPLGQSDVSELLGNLVGDVNVATTVLTRIGDTAEGNPLFIEELVAMLVDEGALTRVNGGWQPAADLDRVEVPPSIAALVAARLDRLEPSERDLIGRASVVGKIFQRSAVAELSPPERREELPRRLMTLVRKELVRPDRSTFVGDEAFRFRHILVRDAAYRALPKEQRSDLHARFAEWLERAAGDRFLEYEEVVAYHLEQAHAYRAELGMADEVTDALRSRAARLLRLAGARAIARVDSSAARNLLSRALTLTNDPGDRVTLLLQIAEEAFGLGDVQDASRKITEAKAVAQEAADEILVLRAQIVDVTVAGFTDPSSSVDGQLLELAERLEALARQSDDRQARVEALRGRSDAHMMRCEWMHQLADLGQLLELVPADSPGRLAITRVEMANALRYGPVPASEAIRRIDRLAEENAIAGMVRRFPFAAPLLAMQRRFEEADELLADGRAFLEERGLRLKMGGFALVSGVVKDLEGDLEGAVGEYAQGIGILHELGETGVLSTLAAEQAVVLFRLGRRDEARDAIKLAQHNGNPTDIATQAGWRVTAAELAADDGEQHEADRLISEAIAMIEPTDFLELRALVFEGLGYVEERGGRADRERAALKRALAEHKRKGNLVGADRVHGQLDRLAAPASSA